MTRGRPLRVTAVLPVLAGGGAEVQMAELLQVLPAYDVECELVTLLSAPPDETLTRRLYLRDLNHTDLAAAPRPAGPQGAAHALRNVAGARTLLHGHLSRSQPDVVYSRLWYAGVAVASLNRRALGFAHVANEENALRNHDDAGLIKRQARLHVIRQADRWVVPSHGLLRDFTRAGGDPRRGQVIHNATRFPDAPRPPAPAGPVRLAAMGRLTAGKGFGRLLDVLADLRRQDVPFTLDIAGEGPDRAALQARIAALNLGAQVRLVGFVPDPLAFLQAHDVFVLSSYAEGFANVLAEAMACGLPAVSFDIEHGPSELIVNGETGLLVPDGDLRGLSDALRSLATDPALRARLGAAGLERARQRFTVGGMAEAFAAVFHSAASGRRQGGEQHVRHSWTHL
ncbi:glycosyltransferase [Deinococcus sp. UR1]|uniref:glycosyltransferase n=1 Tax=Deinococcus sp. UR1 TaxID=1704277 RepID=UPI000C1766DF|nr:glycosyltransferase [Deinococcus sp. UR1]PIG96614.1 hypothetical protein AMD26_016370 [Deinococcus sp. UR1]